jgi:hypothetical protein
MPDHSPEDLPSGWAEKSDAYGRTYYADSNTQSTSWNHPLKLQREAEERTRREAQEAEERARRETEEAKHHAEAAAAEEERRKLEDTPQKTPKSNPALLVAEKYGVENAVEYEGETNEAGLPNGQGLMVYDGGTQHEGSFVEGKCEGPGMQTFVSKCKFIGLFKDNEKSGYGEYIFANGNKFNGEFQNDQRHGKVYHCPFFSQAPLLRLTFLYYAAGDLYIRIRCHFHWRMEYGKARCGGGPL